jgi:hypothetical protein
MIHLTMKLKILLSAVALLGFTLSVKAQNGSQQPPEQPGKAIMQPFSILMQLEPVMLNAGPEFNLSQKVFFSFDVSKTKEQFPGLIRTQTIWTQKGKNNPVATNKEIINAEQIIPLLVAALQQQRAELIELKQRLDNLQAQSGSNHSNN